MMSTLDLQKLSQMPAPLNKKNYGPIYHPEVNPKFRVDPRARIVERQYGWKARKTFCMKKRRRS